MNVLAIEDSEDQAALLQLVLGSVPNCFVQVRTHDFETILADTDWAEVDVVLCDQYLDGYDGKQILHWLSEHDPRVKRIMLTADALTVKADTFADEVLVKPVHASTLIRALGGRNG